VQENSSVLEELLEPTACPLTAAVLLDCLPKVGEEA
jgi:hypothetical protein